MTQPLYDPDNWLTSTTRALEGYITSAFNPDLVTVEMSFPDTMNFSKQTPLPKVLVHVEQDDDDEPILGFGNPGREVVDEPNHTVALHEAQGHLVNFDVGVWTSAECGGETSRMETVEALKNLLAGAGAKLRAKAAMGGVEIVSFNGGRNFLDRINDIPVWRAGDMTLVVRVFSRRVTPEEEMDTLVDADEGFTQTPALTIDGITPVN